MANHLFAVGQAVRLINRAGLSPKAAETYLVTDMLPARDNSPQYRIRNDEMSQERVAAEKNLEKI